MVMNRLGNFPWPLPTAAFSGRTPASSSPTATSIVPASPRFGREIQETDGLNQDNGTQVLNGIRQYQNAMAQARHFAGKEFLTAIVPQTALPAKHGVGTLYSKEGRQVVDFLALHGFNAIQVLPPGEVRPGNPSPYTGTLWARSRFVDMKQLASPELGSLVPEARIQEIFSGLGPKSVNSDQAYQMIDFEKAFPKYDQAFHEAFENFNRKKADALKGKLPAGEKSAIVRLAKEFHQFKKENTFWLLPYGMYQTMYRQYGNTEALSPNSHWREKDRNMFDVPPPELSAEEVAKRFYTPAQKKERIAELMRDPLFQESAFVQFLIHKQHKEFRHFMNEVPTDPKNGERGMRLIGDLQVGPSPLDTWANRHIYLKGLFMGVGGQKWDFPIPRPDLVYNPDGTLGPAGRYYHELSRKFMDDFNAVRVDHPRGLIDALTYPEGEFPRDNVNINPLNSSPFHPQLGRFSQIPTRHTQALQIMTDAAREAGLDPQKDILTEYFGDGSDIEGTTLGQFGLRGMRTSYWHNPDNAGDGSAPKNFPTNVIGQFGNHDNSRLFEWAKAPKQSRDPFARNLAWRLKPHANDGERRQFEEQMRFNSGTLAQATAADIVASPARHVQFFLGDIIGWEDPFNVPGNPGNTEQTNWRQQMTPEWKEHYYQRVADQKALNPARMMEWALNTREDSIPDAQRPAFERVRKELRHFANILDEQPVGQQSQQKTAEKSFHVVA